MTTHKQLAAWVRQPSGRKLNLLSPDGAGWSDEDLAIGLSRTFRWGGHSIWPMPLSVAQHSIMVLAIAEQYATKPLSAHDALRELLHDAEEALIGGFDPISPLKPFLGDEFKQMNDRLQAAIFSEYNLIPWTDAERMWHKQADKVAAASEAINVAGWTRTETQNLLGIRQAPLNSDPLTEIYDSEPWKPWEPDVAADRFLSAIRSRGGRRRSEQ
jgi:hypothetical protein